MAPTDVAAGNGRFVEWEELIPRVSRVVRHDRLARIDPFHELADHAIRVDRHFVGNELAGPAILPAFAGGLQFLFDGSPLGPADLAVLHAKLFQQGDQRQRGIAQNGDVGDVILIKVARVERRMHDFLAGRNGRCEHGARQTAADAEDHVAAFERTRAPGRSRSARRRRATADAFHRTRSSPRAWSSRVRQDIRRRRPDRSRPAVEHSLAGPDHRPLGLEQQSRRVADGRGIRTDPHRLDRRVFASARQSFGGRRRPGLRASPDPVGRSAAG